MPATPPPLILPTKSRKTNRRSSTALSKARARLRGVLREDSDDELGDEDLPWEWVRDPKEEDKIVGARMGAFEAYIGDCVLIKGEGLKGEAYVGMCCEFGYGDGEDEGEDEAEMKANVMWFSTEAEIREGRRKRSDYLPVPPSDPSALREGD